MPYNQAEKIVLSSDGNSDTLVVTSKSIYHTDRIPFGVKCGCENSYTLSITSDSFSIDIRFNNSMVPEQSEFVMNDEWLEFKAHLDNLAVNGKSYADVIVYDNSLSADSTSFLKIIVSKSIGILSIQKGNVVWFVEDDSYKQIITVKADFKSIDC